MSGSAKPLWDVRSVRRERTTTASLHAQTRLSEAFKIAGFESIQFEMEPVAAAHYYEASLDHDELILIGDFGGGTSDFSLVRVGPGVRARGRRPADLLGNAGVGLAGDAFDARIIRHLVSPALGAGTDIRSIGRSCRSWLEFTPSSNDGIIYRF